MESDTQPLISVCTVCHNETKEIIDVPCCKNCNDSLTLSSVRREYASNSVGVEPMIPVSVIDEVSLAIANSAPEETGCSVPKSNKATKKYYKSLNNWLNAMSDLNDAANDSSIPLDANEATLCVRSATYVSFGINFMLLVGKALALASSSSYTIISSLADSCLDLIAGIIISCTAAHSKFTREDLGRYPVGKARVSTVGILIFSVLMTCAALFIIIQCLMSLLNQEHPGETTTLAMIIMGATIAVKLSMWIVYTVIGHPLTIALAEDHRNDVLTNSLGLIMYWGTRQFWWLDAVGGIALSSFVLVSWVMNTYENAKMLMGEAAPPEIIRNITYVAAHHHPLIKEIEQVIAFQVGPEYFAELHIVIPGHVPLEVAHWIGETLQLKVEKIPEIERAWVHVDCEFHSDNEHLLSMKATGKMNKTPLENVSEVMVP